MKCTLESTMKVRWRFIKTSIYLHLFVYNDKIEKYEEQRGDKESPLLLREKALRRKTMHFQDWYHFILLWLLKQLLHAQVRNHNWSAIPQARPNHVQAMGSHFFCRSLHVAQPYFEKLVHARSCRSWTQILSFSGTSTVMDFPTSGPFSSLGPFPGRFIFIYAQWMFVSVARR